MGRGRDKKHEETEKGKERAWNGEGDWGPKSKNKVVKSWDQPNDETKEVREKIVKGKSSIPILLQPQSRLPPRGAAEGK